MALWQFSLHLVPRAALEACFGELPARLDPELWVAEEIDWWAGHSLCADYQMRLDAMLPRLPDHWSKSTTAWGAYDSDIVEISWEKGSLESVQVRLNLAHAKPDYWRAICELGSESDCCLLTEDMMLIPSKLEALLQELEQSSASRFLADPWKFFDSFRDMPRLM